MLERTSLDAAAMTSSRGFGCVDAAFSRRRRKTFSTSTIASSTTMPIATAMPPRVMLFTPVPNRLNVMSVIANESGMAVRVMNVVRRFSKKSTSTMLTMIAPSRIASLRLPIAFSMKSPCRKSTLASTPCGRVGRNSSSAFSIAAVSLSVSKPGALSMLRTTPADSPVSPANAIAASPRIGATPNPTLATSPMVMMRSPLRLMTDAAMSAGSAVIARLRTMISRGPACR